MLTRTGLRAALATKEGQTYKWIALAVTSIGPFMALLDTTAINIALPPIMTSFATDVRTAQWILTGYLLALAVIIPATGYVAERLGYKQLFLLVLGLFTASSLLCGLAWSIHSLIAFRVLQGLGGGMLQPLSTSIVLQVIRAEERAEFMAVLGLPALLAPILGPTVGGYLVERIGWRVIFTMNIPVGLLATVLCWAVLRDYPRRRELTFDWRGFVLSAVAFSSLLLGFSNGADLGWTAPMVAVPLALGACALAAWIWVELTQADPLLDLRLFAKPVFLTSTGVIFTLMLSLFGFTFLMPIFLERVRGLGPMEAGLIIFPQALASFPTMNVAGKLYKRTGPRPLALLGLSLLALATWLMSRVTVATSDHAITGIMVLRGVAMGLVASSLQTAALTVVSRARAARGTALMNVSQRLFGSFATALLATIIHTGEASHRVALAQASGTSQLSAQLQETAAVLAFNDAFRFMFAICLLGLGIALFIPTGEKLRRAAQEAERAVPVTFPTPEAVQARVKA